MIIQFVIDSHVELECLNFILRWVETPGRSSTKIKTMALMILVGPKREEKSFGKRDLSTKQCYKCREIGQHAKSCTNVENKASPFINVPKK